MNPDKKPDPAEHVVVYVMCRSQEEAEKIATRVVNEKLAACVNILPGVLSIYVWEGKVQREKEILLIMKTRFEKIKELEVRVKGLHSYSVPEYIVLPILEGSKEYLGWVTEIVQ